MNPLKNFLISLLISILLVLFFYDLAQLLKLMIKYYIYHFESENFKEVSKDVFYSTMRFLKSMKSDFTQENVYRFVNGDLTKEKRLIENSVSYTEHG